MKYEEALVYCIQTGKTLVDNKQGLRLRYKAGAFEYAEPNSDFKPVTAGDCNSPSRDWTVLEPVVPLSWMEAYEALWAGKRVGFYNRPNDPIYYRQGNRILFKNHAGIELEVCLDPSLFKDADKRFCMVP